MSKPTLLTSILGRITRGASLASDLEDKHLAAERSLTAANAALQAATLRYEAALGEGRDAAIVARQGQTIAEVDLDIARRSVDTLTRQVSEAHEAVRLAEIEHKQAEAERARSVFEETARQQLAQMGVAARAIVRAWAEAELAIEEARQAQGSGYPDIPAAEEFRNVRRTPRKEVSRKRITRWIRPGTNEPYPDEFDRKIASHGGKGWLPDDRASGGGHEVSDRGEFDRVTYVKAQGSITMPLLIESLSIPALVGGQAPGWLPTEDFDPRTILARLTDFERTPTPIELGRETVDEFVHLVGAGPSTASA